jgi:VIT1/CCC1 family predicted Fe2+/Mn2+ transporter
MVHDALGAHARDELGISVHSTARPVQAALASAATFFVGGAIPLLTLLAAPRTGLVPMVFGVTLVSLSGLGLLGAKAGGAPLLKAAVRVTFWGALAMGVTAAVGALFGTIV